MASALARRVLLCGQAEADTMVLKDWLAYALAVSAGVLVTMLLSPIR
ncbi:MAG TPA: hypothetical protein VF653_13225 [Methylomirabilota bacterium]